MYIHKMFSRCFMLFLTFVFMISTGWGAVEDSVCCRKSNVRYFEFAIHGLSPQEPFIAATSDTAVISQCEAQLQLPEGQRNLHIDGPIDSTNGGYNFNWSWHFIPDQWELALVSIELCDGIPSFVEADLPYWLGTVGSFCPWSSYVRREVSITCCENRGNVDGIIGGAGPVDVADVTYLIAYLFQGGPEPPCSEEGNVDNVVGPGGPIDVSDLTYLVAFLFEGGVEPPLCD